MVDLYSNDFLAEVIFEVYFEDDENWDWTIPGEYYQKIKKELPHKTQKKEFVINLKGKSDGKPYIEDSIPKEQINRLVFNNDDKTLFIQVGPRSFTFNCLNYLGWESFKKDLVKYFDEYRNILDKYKIKKMDLRYINRFENKAMKNQTSDYFKIKPNIPIDCPLKNFFISNELEYKSVDSKLLLNMGNPPNNKDVIVLDFNFITYDVSNFNDYESWLENAHDNIKEAFNSCITEKTKEVLTKGGDK